MDKASFFILNIFLNSLLAFFTVTFLIEGFIFLFRVRQGRFAAALRMIPIFKLPLDLCLYDFSRWSYAQGINPLNCEEGTRTLSIMFGSKSYLTDWLFLPIPSNIQMSIPGNMTFTLADMIGHVMSPMLLKISALMFVLISLVILMKRLMLYYSSIKVLDSLVKTSELSSRKIRNSTLISCLKKCHFQILTPSSMTGSPFVAGLIAPIVYVPNNLSQHLFRKEYEAVLAHEIEHIRNKDSLVRLILDFIESIFWWVPTKWLHNRIEEGQEVGCDLNCKKYGVNPLDLASAICKSARHSTNSSIPILTHHLTKRTIHKRVDLLLRPDFTRFRKIRFALSFLAFGLTLVLIFLGSFWIF